MGKSPWARRRLGGKIKKNLPNLFFICLLESCSSDVGNWNSMSSQQARPISAWHTHVCLPNYLVSTKTEKVWFIYRWQTLNEDNATLPFNLNENGNISVKYDRQFMRKHYDCYPNKILSIQRLKVVKSSNFVRIRCLDSRTTKTECQFLQNNFSSKKTSA